MIVAYSLCVALNAATTLCVPMTAKECKEGKAWYLAHGYEVTCQPADQPLPRLANKSRQEAEASHK